MENTIVIIVGPTAVGKTEYAINIAQALQGEIISADSMQLYRYLDIGSAKPTSAERALVPHHLVDEIDPRTSWSVAEYQKLAKKYISEVFMRGNLPIVSGGTGLYINSLLYDMNFSVLPRQPGFREKLEVEATTFGPDFLHDRLKKLDHAAAERIHPHNIKKVIRAIEVCESSGDTFPEFSKAFMKTGDYRVILIGLFREREELNRRIDARVEALLSAGLINEVEDLLRQGLTENDISMKGIGYKEIIGYIGGKYEKEEAVRLIKLNTRHYAKRQMTWFRRYSDIHWFDLTGTNSPEEKAKEIIDYIRTKIATYPEV